MDLLLWITIAGVVLIGLVMIAGLLSVRRRRAVTVDHIRVELHEAHIIEDRVIEAVWRAAVSMTNISRRPRMLPVLAERATVRTRCREYLAVVSIDADLAEINPGEVALAWVEFVLPSPARPLRVDLGQLTGHTSARCLRFRCRTGSEFAAFDATGGLARLAKPSG